MCSRHAAIRYARSLTASPSDDGRTGTSEFVGTQPSGAAECRESMAYHVMEPVLDRSTILLFSGREAGERSVDVW